jgi:hypothetical protein
MLGHVLIKDGFSTEGFSAIITAVLEVVQVVEARVWRMMKIRVCLKINSGREDSATC